LGTSPAEAPARRLDPFVFPAETRGRFQMLVVAALLVGLNLGQVFTNVTRGPADAGRMLHAIKQYGPVRSIDVWHPDPVVLENLRRDYSTLCGALLGLAVERLAIPCQALALLTLLALGIYRLHPLRIRRRHSPEILSESQAPEVVGYLRRCAVRLGVPWVRIEHRTKDQRGACEGQAYGLRGREGLLLYGRLRLWEGGWKRSLRAVALHELGHVVNRDAAERERASAVWQALVVVVGLGLVGLAVSMPTGSMGGALGDAPQPLSAISLRLAQNFFLPFAGLLIFVRMLQIGLIRSRELYADARVVSWNHGESLDRLLGMQEQRSESWWKRWLGLHPSYQARREVLADPGRLFRISPGLAFVTGVLLMILFGAGFPFLVSLGLLVAAWSGTAAGWLPAPDTPVLLLLEMFLVQALPAILFVGLSLSGASYLVAETLGVQVQREAVADLAAGPSPRDWGYLRLLVPAMWLSLGFEVGNFLAPFGPLPSVLTRFSLLPVWFVGFTLLTWLWLVYLRAATRLSLGLGLGLSNPERLRSLVVKSGALLLTVLYWPAALTRVVFMIRADQLPHFMTNGQAPWETYVYLFVMTPMMFAVSAGAIYVPWTGAGLVAAVAALRARKSRCTRCGAPTLRGFAIGRFCAACGTSLAPWVYQQTPADPGTPGPPTEAA
jgi:hypothetical protein